MTQTKHNLSPADWSRCLDWAPWVIWIVFIVILTWVTGSKTAAGRNSVIPDYRGGSLAWVNSQPIYDLKIVNGFVYMPSSAVLMVPLAELPASVNEFAFRWASIFLLAWSLWRISQVLRPRMGESIFLILTLCVLPAAAGPTRAGQMNVPLAAMMALAVVEGMSARWWWAAFWLGLAFALKPQAIVLAAIMIAICPPLRLRGAAAIVAALLLPFLFQMPWYVLEQYRLCAEKLTAAGRPGEVGVHFSDLSGILGALGVQIPENIRWAIRATAALLALMVCWQVWRRGDRVNALLAMLAYSAAYLMLFNPRTEGGSYVIAAVPLAVYAAWELLRKRWGRGGVLIAIALGWGLSFNVSEWLWLLAHRVGIPGMAKSYREGFGPYWLSPTLGILFLAYLLWVTVKREAVAGVRLSDEPADPKRSET